MIKKEVKLSKPDKILIAIYEITKGKKIGVKFEDLVVKIFKKYKEDFHLMGYPQYPDSEVLGKEIYRQTLKDKGLLSISNRVFTLTEKGLEYVELINNKNKNKNIFEKTSMPRYINNELQRLERLEGLKLYLNDQIKSINDTDFYYYLGVSVRSKKDNIMMRINIMSDVIEELEKDIRKKNEYKNIINYHYFINNKYKSIINFYKNSK